MQLILSRPHIDLALLKNVAVKVVLPMVAIATVAIPAARWWGQTHEFIVNLSVSLPGYLYLSAKGSPIDKGGFVAFDPGHSSLVVRHFGGKRIIFVKKVMGVAGDIVRRDSNRNVFVNNVFVGRAKPKTIQGEPLVPGPVGRIPNGCIYAGSTHVNGLDSRYSAIGFICGAQIYGAAKEIL